MRNRIKKLWVLDAAWIGDGPALQPHRESLHHWCLTETLLFWRLPGPAGHKTQFFESSFFSVCFWSGFRLAKEKWWVTGNRNSRRCHGSKCHAGPTGQDGTFAKRSLLKLVKRQVESLTNWGLNCYSKVLSTHNFPTMIWAQNRVMMFIQNPHLSKKM